MLATLGTPEVAEQRILWIRNTLELNRVAVSSQFAKRPARDRLADAARGVHGSF